MMEIALYILLFSLGVICGNGADPTYRDYKYYPEHKSFFRMHLLKTDWYEAQRICRAEGATLATPANEAEARTIRDLTRTNGYPMTNEWSGPYLGIHDLFGEGLFVSLEGESINKTFHKWGEGEPNNKYGEHCIQLFRDTLNDMPCNDNIPFVCKKPVVKNINKDGCDMWLTVSEGDIRVKRTIEAFDYYDAPATIDNDIDILGADSLYKCTMPSFRYTYFCRNIHFGITTLAPTAGSITGTTTAATTSTTEAKTKLSNEPHFKYDYAYNPSLSAFYKLYTTDKTWRGAYRQCHEDGARLAYPTNNDEALFLNDTLNTLVFANTSGLFVGIHDLFKEEHFMTIDGEDVSNLYNIWSDNVNLEKDKSELCTQLKHGGILEAISCTVKLPFMCKKALPSRAVCNGSDTEPVPLTPSQVDKDNSFTDYTTFGKHKASYRVHTLNLNWKQAFRVCLAEEAKLVIPTNVDELNTLMNLKKDSKFSAGGEYIHIGVTNLLTNGNNLYNQKLPAVFDAFLKDLDTTNDDGCIKMGSDGKFNLSPCESRLPFICKRHSEKLTYAVECPYPQLNAQINSNSGSKFFRKDYLYNETFKAFYKLHKPKATWWEALLQCRSEGSELAVLETEDETNFVKALMEKGLPDNSEYSGIILGIHDFFGENMFVTINDQPLRDVYHKWSPGEPSNGQGNEDCIQLKKNGLINDIHCGVSMSFLCKLSVDMLTESCKDAKIPDGPFFRSDYNYSAEYDAFYKLHEFKTSWARAFEMCQGEDAELAIPENKQEANYLELMIKNSPRSRESHAIHVGIHSLFGKIDLTVDGRPAKNVFYELLETTPYRHDHDKNKCFQLTFDPLLLTNSNCDSIHSPYICKKSNVKNTTTDGASKQRNNNTEPSALQTVPSFRNEYIYESKHQAYYKHHFEPRTWFEAYALCRAEGSGLIVIDNESEAKTVVNLTSHGNTAEQIALHVGIHDLFAENVFVTINDKSFNDVFNVWADKEPNDQHGSEDCVYLKRFTMVLSDGSCSNELPFVCKKTIEDIQKDAIGAPADAGKPKNYFRSDYEYDSKFKAHYKLHDLRESWFVAYQICSAEGAHLAVPETKMEISKFLGMMGEPSRSIREIFLGAHNSFGVHEFKTIEGDVLLDIDTWRHYYLPSVDRSSGILCIAMNTGGKINPHQCKDNLNFICKKKAEVTSKTKKPRSEPFFRDDYEFYEKSSNFYKVHYSYQSYHSAKNTCTIEGASLAAPQSAEEVDTLIEIIQERDYPTYAAFFLSSEYKRDLIPKAKGFNTSSSSNRDNIEIMNPSDCTELLPSGRVTDVPCSKELPFICERSRHNLTYNSACDTYDPEYLPNKTFGKCYKSHDESVLWEDALSICHMEQAQLAVISSQEEADFLISLVQMDILKYIHMGFYDYAGDGNFVIINNNLTSMWDLREMWAAGEPSSTEFEKCGGLDFDSLLHDLSCNHLLRFVCVKDAFLSSEGQGGGQSVWLPVLLTLLLLPLLCFGIFLLARKFWLPDIKLPTFHWRRGQPMVQRLVENEN